MLHFINKDIIVGFMNNEIDIIAHQCNCTKGMGAGVAKQIAVNFPISERMDEVVRKDFDLIGINHLIEVEENKYICNMYSQYYIGGPTDKLFKYDTIINSSSGLNFRFAEIEIADNMNNRLVFLKDCLHQIKDNTNLKDKRLGIPLLASGLAADTNKKTADMTDLEYFKLYIAPTVLEVLDDRDVFVYYI